MGDSNEHRIHLANSIAGGLGNVMGLLSTYPLTVIKTRLQAQNKKKKKIEEKTGEKSEIDDTKNVDAKDDNNDVYDGPMDCLMKVVSRDGVLGMYSGISLKLVETYLWNSTFYMFFSVLKPHIDDIIKREHAEGRGYSAYLLNVAHGMMAGMGTQLCLFPMNVVNTRMVVLQHKKGKNEKNTGIVENYIRVIRDVYAEGGVSAFWRGIAAGLMLTINPGIMTMIRIRLTELCRANGYTGGGVHFWVGFVSKMMASTVTYPLVVARSQIIVSAETSEDNHTLNDRNTNVLVALLLSIIKNILHVPRTIMRVVEENGGLVALYAGFTPHLSQAALKEAIANTVRNKASALLLAILTSKRQQP